MKKNLVTLLIFLTQHLYAQSNFNLAVPDNQVLTLTGGLYGNIQLGKNSKLFIYGDVIVSNINGTKLSPYKITVSGLGKLKVLNDFFLDGSDTLFNAGHIQVRSIVMQNESNYVYNIGNLDINENFQINNLGNKVFNEGQILVRNSLTFNSVQDGAYEATNCSMIEAYNIKVFSNNPVKGKGNVSFNYASFGDNMTFTQSSEIFIIYFPLPPDKQWGAAKLNSGFCMGRSFPVKFLQTSFVREGDQIKYDLEVDKFSNIYNFSIEKSTEGKNWEEVLVPVESDRLSKSYT